MNSTNPTLVGWQTEGGGRGTWGIIWSCLTTALIAIWVIYHGPAPWDHSSISKRSWPWNKATVELVVQALMTVFAILLPEVYIYLSAWQLAEAKEFRDRIRNSRPSFTLREAFFVCMGGYRVWIPKKFRSNREPSRETGALTAEQIEWLIREDILGWSEEETKNRKQQPALDPAHDRSLAVSTISQITPDARNNHKPETNNNALTVSPQAADPKAVTNTTVHEKANSGKFITMKKQAFLLDCERIELRSKASGFAKFVVVFQAFWFIVNCIARGAHQLPLSLPEVLTLSYIVCTFITYSFWWHKPQDVGECATLDFLLTDSEWKEIVKRGGEKGWNNGTTGLEYSNQYWSNGESSPSIYWLTIVAGWLSGGIHFIAWNADFPSTAECILWRTCTIILMFTTPWVICDSRILFFQRNHFMSLKWRYRLSNLGGSVAAIAKLIVLLLAILSLRSAPEAIYDTYEITNYLLLSL